MVHNVRAIDAVLADGSEHAFGEVSADTGAISGPRGTVELVRKIRSIAAREAEEIEHRVPKLLRRVGGYNLDLMNEAPCNIAHLLVGSEGTLAYSRRIHLKLAPVLKHRVLGVCHFRTFYQAMEAPRHIVKLEPAAVELVDRTMIGLARANPAFRATVEQVIQGDPDAILLVEFAGDDHDVPLRSLRQLVELVGDASRFRRRAGAELGRQHREGRRSDRGGEHQHHDPRGDDGAPTAHHEACEAAHRTPATGDTIDAGILDSPVRRATTSTPEIALTSSAPEEPKTAWWRSASTITCDVTNQPSAHNAGVATAHVFRSRVAIGVASA